MSKDSISIKEYLDKYPEAKTKPIKKDWYVRIPRNWWRNELGELDCVQKCLLIDLMTYADKTGKCWPAIRRIAKDLGIDKNTVMKHTRLLAKKGFIKMEKSQKNYKWYYKLV